MRPDKYSIISIDDSRAEYKERIRSKVNGTELHVPAIDGSKVDLEDELIKRSLVPSATFNKGEIGVWLSVFDQWERCFEENDDVIVFEDDAVPTDSFNGLVRKFNEELPPNYGLLSLWVPPNQYYDYLYDVKFDENGGWEKIGPDLNTVTSRYNFGAIRIAKAYQGYGNVAMQYSPNGAMRLIDFAQDRGMFDTIDCFIFNAVHIGVLDGYSPKPMWARAVDYDWAAETTIHNTENYAL